MGLILSDEMESLLPMGVGVLNGVNEAVTINYLASGIGREPILVPTRESRMLKVVVGLGIALVTLMFGIQYFPGVAEAVPQESYLRDVASPLAVIIAIAAMLLWRPSDVATEE